MNHRLYALIISFLATSTSLTIMLSFSANADSNWRIFWAVVGLLAVSSLCLLNFFWGRKDALGKDMKVEGLEEGVLYPLLSAVERVSQGCWLILHDVGRQSHILVDVPYHRIQEFIHDPQITVVGPRNATEFTPGQKCVYRDKGVLKLVKLE